MQATARGEFSVESWDEKTYQELEGGAKLTRAHIRQRFTGDLEGQGDWEALMCYRTDGTATYVGFVRIEGRLGGRSGTFVARTTGGYDGKEARWSLSVVAGSGTGELEELAGDGEAAAPHGPKGSWHLSWSESRDVQHT
ncbi:MAG TPA: DUF3224 domain-containing protein [Candidatus Limnocylindria bacterium]